MPVRREPGRHFSRVFADARGFRSKVEAADEDLHDFELRGGTGLVARPIRSNPGVAAIIAISIADEVNLFT